MSVCVCVWKKKYVSRTARKKDQEKSAHKKKNTARGPLGRRCNLRKKRSGERCMKAALAAAGSVQIYTAAGSSISSQPEVAGGRWVGGKTKNGPCKNGGEMRERRRESKGKKEKNKQKTTSEKEKGVGTGFSICFCLAISISCGRICERLDWKDTTAYVCVFRGAYL